MPLPDDLASKEVKITPEMIHAGVQEYEDWRPGDFPHMFTEPDLVRRIFAAMTRAAGGC